jgi:hypothetical protein
VYRLIAACPFKNPHSLDGRSCQVFPRIYDNFERDVSDLHSGRMTRAIKKSDFLVLLADESNRYQLVAERPEESTRATAVVGRPSRSICWFYRLAIRYLTIVDK